MNRKLCTVCFGLFALTLSAMAQEAQMVTLRFISFPKSANPEPVQLLIGPGETMEIKAPTNALSTPYRVKRLSVWSVGKVEPAKSKDEKPTFISYGSAPSLESSDQIILLIRNGKENLDSMQVIPMDNRSNNFGGGQFFFMNATTVDIAGMLGGSKFSLKPKSYIIIKPAELKQREEEGKGMFFTEFYFRKDDDVRPFFSSTWPHNEKARSMVFFYHDPHNDRLRMHTIRDYLP
ncbi:MAG: hypothetical protein ACK40T_06335 [Akkermansiaceae bacterium]